MAKETKAKGPAEEKQDGGDFRINNIAEEKHVLAAMDEIAKEKDEKKIEDLKSAIGCASYDNVKTRYQLRARRREADITKERLEATKVLLERLAGVKMEIKDGVLVPTKEKIDASLGRLTKAEYQEEKRKLAEEIDKKTRESDRQLDKDLRELRNSYEGRYEYWWG